MPNSPFKLFPGVFFAHFPIAFTLIAVFSLIFLSQDIFGITEFPAAGRWKGNAILGSGTACAVYSDDDRIAALSGVRGIQHFYISDYTVDYLRGSSFNLIDTQNSPGRKALRRTGMEPFYCVSSEFFQAPGIITNEKSYFHPSGSFVCEYTPANNAQPVNFEIVIGLRNEFRSSVLTKLKRIEKDKFDVAYVWDNGKGIQFFCGAEQISYHASDSLLQIRGRVKAGATVYLIVSPFFDEESPANTKLRNGLEKLKPQADAFWNRWIGKMKGWPLSEKGKIQSDNFEFLKRTIYSVRAASLNGHIPADMTGQFVTNGMPQLYPRDAMKCARVFLRLGYVQEAAEIIKFWCGSKVPHKSRGEFYARYDAYGAAVDAGSGARYDEPEWDANGYLITLLNDYHAKTGTWLAGKEFIYELADFLVHSIDSTGLLFEGGIVEWSGYLPTTNMICASALKSASLIAEGFGHPEKARKYKSAAERISKNLRFTFDPARKAYSAVRYTGVKAGDNSSFTGRAGTKKYLWDCTAQFGYLWGFPKHAELDSTISFYEKETVRSGGGLQYFEALDAGLSAYGNDIFFFTTASLAQYYARTGNFSEAKKHINWMKDNANIYGLMPERIYLNLTDCSDASPLSWCNAEFAAAVYEYLARSK